MSIQTLKDMPLAAMRDEVYQVNVEHGWFEDDRLFDESMALLHTEIAEASDAWRRWGLSDATGRVTQNHLAMDAAKPEGVGSEFADILVRLLDNDQRHGIDLPALFAEFTGAFSVNDSFMVNMNTLHVFVAQASILFEDEMPEFCDVSWQGYLTRTLTFLVQLSEHYGIDLMAEYQRKIAYNRTRPYRHGDKRL